MPAVLIGTALLLVSTLPIWSFKNFKVPSEYVLPTAAGHGRIRGGCPGRPVGRTGWGEPDLSRMLPFSVRSFRRLRREAEAPRDELDVRRESA